MSITTRLGSIKKRVSTAIARRFSAPDLYCVKVARDIIAEHKLDTSIRSIHLTASREAAKTGQVPVVIEFANGSQMHLTSSSAKGDFNIYASGPNRRPIIIPHDVRRKDLGKHFEMVARLKAIDLEDADWKDEVPEQ